MKRLDLVLMGRASGGFGTKGELRVFSFAEDDSIFTGAGKVYAGPNPESVRKLTPVSQRSHSGRLLLTTEELGTREDADALRGAWVYVERGALKPLEGDEYYWADIKGLEVRTTEGKILGKVASVSDNGAHELWLVRGGRGREALLPIINGAIRELDLEKGLAVLALPEGLLEAQGWEE